MRRKRLRSLGLVLVVVGAAVLLAPTLGFDRIDAERSVAADAAANPNAQLGLQEDYNGSQIVYTTFFGYPTDVQNQTVANVTNRVGNPLSVSVEVASVQWSGGSGPVLEVVNDDDFSDPLGTNATRAVRLGCSQTVGGTANAATVELAFDATGDPVSVEGATQTIEGVDFQCEGAGGGQPPDDPIPIDDNRIDLALDGTPSAGGWRNTVVTYSIQNTGSSDATITGIHLSNSTSGSLVMNYGGAEVDITGATTPGDLDASNGIEIGADAPRYDLDQNAVVGSGETADVTLTRFRSSSGFFDTVDMSGDTVTVVLMVEGLDVAGRDDPIPVEMTITVS